MRNMGRVFSSFLMLAVTIFCTFAEIQNASQSTNLSNWTTGSANVSASTNTSLNITSLGTETSGNGNLTSDHLIGLFNESELVNISNVTSANLTYFLQDLTTTEVTTTTPWTYSVGLKTDCDVNSTLNEIDLIRVLLTDYKKYGPPSEPVQLQIGLRLFGILDFDERINLLSLQGYFKQVWADPHLNWQDKPEYRCITRTDYIIILAEAIWIPDMTISNSPDEGRWLLFDKSHHIYLYETTDVEIDPQGRFSVKCQLNLLYYPFDEQICDIVYESWFYPKTMVNVSFLDPPMYKSADDWTEHPMWTVVDLYSEIIEAHNFQQAHFTLLLRRKPLYYYINTVAPALIIGVVNAIIFTLPLRPTEVRINKITISVTCLLAFTVFQTQMVSDLPKSSANMPLLLLFIDLEMFYIALTICSQAVVYMLIANVEYGEAPPSASVSKSFKRIGNILCVTGTVKAGKSLERTERQTAAESWGGLGSNFSLKTVSAGLPYKVLRSDMQGQWIFVARVLDRICLVLYIVALAVTPPILYFAIPVYNGQEKFKNQ